jgi:hypothetical protein
VLRKWEKINRLIELKDLQMSISTGLKPENGEVWVWKRSFGDLRPNFELFCVGARFSPKIKTPE